jgi:hypothetical protein
MRQGFDPLIGTALTLYKRQSAPPNPQNGWLWYREDNKRYQARVNGVTHDVPLVISRSTTAVSVTNTTNETALLSFPVPGGHLQTDRVLRITSYGRYTNNSGGTDTLTIRTSYGGQPWRSITAAIGASATARAVRILYFIAPANSTTAQRFHAEVTIGDGVAATTGIGDLATADFADNIGFRAGTVNSSASDQTASISVQHTTANANITFVGDFYVAEIL